MDEKVVDLSAITSATTDDLLYIVDDPGGTPTDKKITFDNIQKSITQTGTLATLTVTAPIVGSVTGNAATVTTNANLTGPVTSTGNATAIANGAISNAMLANSAVANLSGTNTGDQTNISGNAATVTTNANLTGDVTSVGNAATVVKINGTSLAGLATGILKNTTTTGVPSIAVAGDFPTLNQNTSGNAATVTTNANLTGVITSSGNATSIASQTGTGTKFVVDTSPTLVTPVLGVATASSVNKVAITAPATAATLTIDDGFTLHATGNVTALSGSHTGTSSGTNTGDQTITLTGGVTGSGTGSFAATVVTNANLTGAVTSSGNATSLGSFSSANLATALTDETGSGAAVFGTNPTIAKPVMSATNPTAQTYTPAGAGTATLDLSLSNQHRITMPAGNITIALSNDTNSQIFLVSITQDSVGSRTVTWFTTIKWAGGTPPTLTTAANKRDTFGFVRTGSGTYDGFVVGQNI